MPLLRWPTHGASGGIGRRAGFRFLCPKGRGGSTPPSPTTTDTPTARAAGCLRDGMNDVASKDGTTIAFDRSGAGRPVILVGGALSDRSAAVPLAAILAPRFTVFAYDRRGRGDSGDTPPYAVVREVEDLDALIAEAGGSVCVFGHSSG